MNQIRLFPDYASRFEALSDFDSGNFTDFPTLGGVAAKIYSDELKVVYPRLALGDVELKIAVISDTSIRHVSQHRYRFVSLVQLMIERLTGLSKMMLKQGEHWLTADDTVFALELLPVNMQEVETITGYGVAEVVTQFKQALANFWGASSALGQSPLSWLARALKSSLYSAALNTHRNPGLSKKQSDLAIAIVLASNRQARLRPPDVAADRAYIVNIDTVRQEQPWLFRLPGLAVLEREEHGQLTLMAYSLERGIEIFESYQAFGLTIASRLDSPLQESAIWSFDEPEDDFFVAVAQTLLDKQLDDISAIVATAQAERWSYLRLNNALTELTQMFNVFTPDERTQFHSISEKLPSWLNLAQPADQLLYTPLLAEESTRQSQNRGHSFLDDVESLPDYARHQLHARILRDHPDAGTLNLDDIEAHELGIDNLQMAWMTDEVMSLVEMSLTYIGGKPPGFLSIRGRNGVELPAWMNADYARQLVSELDIGSAYIALLKRLLIDDEALANTRRQLFKTQLRNQLPMVALEKKIKKQSGLTGPGFRIIQQLMLLDSLTDSDTLVIRPLEFAPYAGAPIDTVNNMFVFGSRHKEQGPFLLYSPFSNEVLREFATWPLLFEAIKQPGELHDQVLEWLPPASRRYYTDGGFDRPHIESVFLEGFLAYLPRDQAALSLRVVRGDHFEFLYNSITLALIQLADKQSISVSERRWIWFKQTAWTLFNGLTFFVSGPWAKAAWLLQVLMSIDTGLQARINNDKTAATQSIVELLFTLALTLLHIGLKFQPKSKLASKVKVAVDEPMFTTPDPQDKRELKSASLEVRPKGSITPHNREEYSRLDFSWFGPGAQMTANQSVSLDTFKTSADLSKATLIDEGPLKGTYTTPGKRWVKIRGAVYRVGREPDGLVVRHDNNILLTGPWLKSDGSGNWDFDLRLRLRGGSPKKTIQGLRAEKELKLQGLEQRKQVLAEQGLAVFKVMSLAADLASNTSRQALIGRFEAEFLKWNDLQNQLMRVLDEMIELGGTETYGQQKVNLLAERARFALRLQKNLEDEHKQLKYLVLTEEFKVQKSEALNSLLSGHPGPYEELVAGLKTTEELERKLLGVSDVMLGALQALKKLEVTHGSSLRRLLHVVDKDPGWRYWNIAYLRTLLELVVKRDGAELLPQEISIIEYFDNSSLPEIVVSQVDVLLGQTLSEVQLVDFFSSALHEYEAATQICRDLETIQSPSFRNEYLPRMIEVLENLKIFAEGHLSSTINTLEAASQAEALPVSGAQASSSTSVQSLPGKPRKVFENDRHQVLVGTVRDPGLAEADQVIDIMNGLTNMKVRSYHNTGRGTWTEIEKSPSPIPLPVPATKDLGKLQVQAYKQLEQVDRIIHSIRSQSKTAQVPVEIEEIFLRHSRAFTDTANSLQKLLVSKESTAQRIPPNREMVVKGLIAELELNAERLKQEGRLVRIEIIKEQPPTAERVDYLSTENEITITKIGSRRYLGKGQHKDFLQEYEIKDKHDKILWYAHFHYDSLESTAQSYTAAHLKTLAQRTLSERAMYAKADSSSAVIGIYRGKIGLALANKLFLNI